MSKSRTGRLVSLRPWLVVASLLGSGSLFAQTPSISSWSPSHAPVGAVVSVAGNNFDASTNMYFNGVAGVSTKVLSQWSLQVTVPSGAKTGPFKVTNAAGSYTSSVNFTVDASSTPAPTIASFTPSHGSPGTQVTISGLYLTGTTAVYFNGLMGASMTVVNDSYIKVNVPTGATTGSIKIVNAGGSVSTSNFVVDVPPPTISSWSPSHGPVGTPVTISGSNLTTTSKVTFNGVAATSLVVNSDWGVSVAVPAGATTGPVTITNAGGSYTAGSPFTVDGTTSSGGGSASGGTSSGGTSSGNTSGGSSGGSSSGGTSSGGTSGGSSGGSSGSTTGAFISPPPIDPPTGAMIGHPRIFVRQSDVKRLQGWANANNPVWNDLLATANSAKTLWDSGQLPADSGGGDAGFTPVEAFAEIFAFVSMVHPDPVAQADFAKRAHDIVMTVMNKAVLGHLSGQPYRDPAFAISNRASWFGEAFPAVVDWVYPTFSTTEKATIRKVFLQWIQDDLTATTTGDNNPTPVGKVNDPSLVATAQQVRWSTNNYYSNHARNVGLMSMALDATDDVPGAASDPPGGTLRRFVGNAIGAWLYAQSKYESTDGAGGIEPQGMGYGEDITLRAWGLLLLAMNTTGTDNPQFYGSQATAITNPYWSQGVIDGYLHLLSPGQTIQQSWIGPAYIPYSFSDNATYVAPDMVRTFGPLALYAMNNGNTAQYMKLRWMIDNLPPGGLNYRHTRITGSYNSTGGYLLPIFYFLVTDPGVAAGTDPRPSESKDYFDPGLGIVLSRTGWTQGDSWMTYKLSWNAIDHQFGDGNAIGFYRNGEWLTMPEAGYGTNIGSSDYQNTIAIQNPGNTNDPFWQPNVSRGSQYIYEPAGDPSPVTHNSTSVYTYVQGESTNLYNNTTISATDVKHASRSALWLKPGIMVVYDRATTGMSGRFKRFHLNTPALATVNGKSASVTTPGGQFFSVDALLPANASLKAVPRETFSDYAEQAASDPMGFRLWSEDLTMPADVRFLNVLQGTSSAAQKLPVSLLQSSAGSPMDGAIVGSTAVMFRHDITTPFAGVTFSVPNTTTSTYVTGLTPGAAYTVSKTPAGNTIQIVVSSGGATVADAGGVLAF